MSGSIGPSTSTTASGLEAPNPVTSVLDLNDDCLRVILGLVKLEDLIRLSLACKDHKDIAKGTPRLMKHQQMIKKWTTVSIGLNSTLIEHDNSNNFSAALLLWHELNDEPEIAEYIKHIHLTSWNSLYFFNFLTPFSATLKLRHITVQSVQHLAQLFRREEAHPLIFHKARKLALSLMDDTAEGALERTTQSCRHPDVAYFSIYTWKRVDASRNDWETICKTINKVGIRELEIVRGRCDSWDIHWIVIESQIQVLRYRAQDKKGRLSARHLFETLETHFNVDYQEEDRRWSIELLEVDVEQELRVTAQKEDGANTSGETSDHQARDWGPLTSLAFFFKPGARNG